MRAVDPRLLRHAQAARSYLIVTVLLGLAVTGLIVTQAALLAHALAAAARGTGAASEYLEAELLARLSQKDREFLTRTAVLERMCGPLCEAVLGRTGAAEVLARLARSNLLLVPLDRRGQWYRYHHLFRDTLLAGLERRTPELIPVLRRRAAGWCLRHNLPEEALEYSIAAADADTAAYLVEKLWVPTYREARVATIQRWLGWLDENGAIQAHPVIAVAAPLVSATTGQPADAERWADLLDRWHYDDRARSGDAWAEAGPAKIRALLCRHGIEQMLADADEAWRKFAAHGLAYPIVAVLQGMAHLFSGDLDRAEARMEDVVRITSEAGGSYDALAVALSERSLLAVAAGDWAGAEVLAGQARAAVRQGRIPESFVTPLVCAQLAKERGSVVPGPSALTGAELRLLPMLSTHLPIHEIAAEMVLSPHTVRTQGKSIYRKLGPPAAARPSPGPVSSDSSTAEPVLSLDSGDVTRPPPASNGAWPRAKDALMTGQDHGGRELIISAPATFVDHVRTDGSVIRLGSRRHRKHQKPATGSTWWAPRARGWWIAILFAVGSLLFALGSIPGYASAVGARWDTVTYFTGSLFFTAASFLSYRETVDASPQELNPAQRRFFVYQPGRIDWWAAGVQLVGTVYFNVSCGVAMAANLSAQASHQHMWRPDAIGSVCFLVSSVLSWYEACHGWAAWRPASWAWWITLLNLIGSIAFGISAVAGYVNPVTGQVHNAGRADTQTLIGAVCFLISAILLLPERTEETRKEVMASTSDPVGSLSAEREYPVPPLPPADPETVPLEEFGVLADGGAVPRPGPRGAPRVRPIGKERPGPGGYLPPPRGAAAGD